MPKSGFLQPRKALETVGVYSRAQRHIFFQKGQERCTFEIRDDGHSSAPGYAAAFLHSHQDQRGFPSLQSAGFPSIRPECRAEAAAETMMLSASAESMAILQRYLCCNSFSKRCHVSPPSRLSK